MVFRMHGKWKDFFMITIGTIVTALGIYIFKFPNHFTFGGVTGIAVVLGEITSVSASTATFILNMFFLVIGFAFLGKSFGIKTAYASILLSVCLSGLEMIFPISKPLTEEPVLEFAFAILLPAIGSGLLFYYEASSGGTDILAMLLKKYKDANIGVGLFAVDLIITACACFVFDIKTALFSIMGLMVKSILIDNVIASMNLSKYVNIVCDKPEPICQYIIEELNKSATVCKAMGAYSKMDKYVIISALKRKQAVQLRKFLQEREPNAFMSISNTSEIFGKGFMKWS